MAAPESRFWSMAQMVPGVTMPSTDIGDDDPIDNAVDTVGTPRNLVDLDQFSALFIWED
jgi:hypothetical protein